MALVPGRGRRRGAAAWSVTYAAIGVLSGSIFDEQWKGIALAIVLVIAVSLGPTLWKTAARHEALP